MAKDIEINYKGQDGGYEVLYPQNWDNDVSVSELVKEVLELSDDSKLDEVLLGLVIPTGKYAIQVTLKTPGGKPYPNRPIEGITSFSGGQVVTDDNGIAIGFADYNSVSLKVKNIAVDIEGDINYSATNLQPKVLNKVDLQFTRKSATSATFESSQNVYFSSDVRRFRGSGIGGGQNGEDAELEDYSGSSNDIVHAGNGGNAGEIKNFDWVNISNGTFLVVEVGSVGADSSISNYFTARGGQGASGGKGCVRRGSNDVVIQQVTGGEDSSGFLYPATQVGGGGGGGGVDNGVQTAQEIGGAGGAPGGGKGGDANNGLYINGNPGTTKGAGGGGAGYIYNTDNGNNRPGTGGAGQSGLCGLEWSFT